MKGGRYAGDVRLDQENVYCLDGLCRHRDQLRNEELHRLAPCEEVCLLLLKSDDMLLSNLQTQQISLSGAIPIVCIS